MKYSPLFFIVLLFACNLKPRKPSPEEVKEIIRLHNDSVTVEMDSLYRLTIPVPPLFDAKIYDSAATLKFYELAHASGGELKLLINSKLITNEIINIISSHAEDNADLLLLVDKTGSMLDDIDNIKKGLGQVIAALKQFNNLRLAIGLYGDKNEDGANWFSYRNFNTNLYAANDFIRNIEVTGGGDWPESVYDGFFKAAEEGFWKSANKRMIILIGDAPPLEKPLSNFSLADVMHKAKESSISMNFYPIVVTPANDAAATPVQDFKPARLFSSIYPNPSSGQITIQLLKNDSYTIEIFNSAGQAVSAELFTGSQFKKNVSALPNGIYVIRVITSKRAFETGKFVLHK